MDVLIEARRLKRTDVTNTTNNVTRNIASLSGQAKIQYLAKLKILSEELKTLDQKIFELKFSSGATSEQNDKEYEDCSKYAEKLLFTITSLQSSIELERTPVTQPSSTNVGNKLKLPQIPLPEFSNREDEELTKFLENFELIIQKYSLTEYEKFVYLKRQLSDGPLALVKSLEGTSQTFACAKALLQQAFATPVIQQYKALQRLTELIFTGENSYEYVSHMREIIDSFKRLKIDIDIVLQYFIWSGLNQDMKTQFVHITNNNKPCLAEIQTHIFDAVERYHNLCQSTNPTKVKPMVKQTAAATTVHSKQAPASNSQTNTNKCSLCSSDGKESVYHSTLKCRYYPTAEEKVKKLKQIRGCVKCGRSNHPTNTCRHRFSKPCSICGNLHYENLCSAQTNLKHVTTKPSTKITDSNLINASSVFLGDTVLDKLGDDVIIPTFSLRFSDGSVIRGMRDSGCQVNFITEKAAHRLKLKVVKQNIPLTIHGFNATETLETKVVQLKVAPNIPPILALCVPKIKTKLFLPNLETVVNAFVSRGYKLADEFLEYSEDNISELDFVLGNSDAQILPQTDELFGSAPQSMYSVSPLGILLSGSVKRILKNIQYLPTAGQQKLKTKHTAAKTSQQVKASKKSIKLNRNHLSKSGSDSLKPQIRSSNADENWTDHMSKSGCDVPEHTVHISASADGDKSHLTKSGNDFPVTVCSMPVVIGKEGLMKEHLLDAAVTEALEAQATLSLHYDTNQYNTETREIDDKLTKFVIKNTERAPDGRIIMPLLWNDRVCHNLAENSSLSKAVLKSNLRRLRKDSQKLLQYDEVISKQAENGIIETVKDINALKQNNQLVSFLPHSAVFRPDHESTKCRVVLLSNLSEKPSNNHQPTINHNQAMLSGPNLNHKISTAITKLRFNKFILLFDLKKAFLSIGLKEADKNKLLFYWYENVREGDFRLKTYKCSRLPFGIKCSPTLLMLAMDKILVQDAKNDPKEIKDLKHLTYDLLYMDNGGISANSEKELKTHFDKLNNIYASYQFALQQFITNSSSLQETIDSKEQKETPETVRLLGLQFNRTKDTLTTDQLRLESEAKTKRQMLSSFASNFDILQVNAPLLNRARLFLHNAQSSPDISWDDTLSPKLLKEWQNICRQINCSSTLEIDRYVGNTNNEFKLVAFTDASQVLVGCVIYIVDITTEKTTFLLAKNRIINRQLKGKSIPSLELHAISFATEMLIDTYQELSGNKTLIPIKINELSLYSDSMVALNWVNSHANKLEKMQKRTPFVMNRLETITRACGIHSINFSFIAGETNPADLMTRPVSYKQLMKTCYITGPAFISTDRSNDTCEIQFTVPHKNLQTIGISNLNANSAAGTVNLTRSNCTPNLDATLAHVIPLETYSSLHHHIRVLRKCMQYIEKLKLHVRRKQNLSVPDVERQENLSQLALHNILKTEQAHVFPTELDYLKNNKRSPQKMPNLVGQLNLFLDPHGIMRVRSKFRTWTANTKGEFPILLPKFSSLTKLIVNDVHHRMNHAGLYSVLSELRKKFFIPHIYTTVKKILRSCTSCRRFNERTLKLNQSYYREFRTNPPKIPFQFVFIDHFGPYRLKMANKQSKVYVLCITCLFCRAINLKVCFDLSVKEFLRTMQLHIFDYGLPELVLSDLGSQIIAGGNIIKQVLDEPEVKLFFEENNLKSTEFNQYFKGNNALGSLVESCVKLSKRLLHHGLRNSKLTLTEFEFFVAQTVSLVNKRPVSYKEALRDSQNNSGNEPSVITPELFIRGYELTMCSILPEKNSDDEDWTPSDNPNADLIKDFEKLSKIRRRLLKNYEEEFLGNLMAQSVSKKDRFKPVTHKKVKPNDIVFLKEDYTKIHKYPLARVLKTFNNSLGESTGFIVKKGNGEEVKRHASSIIPFIAADDIELEQNTTTIPADVSHRRPRRTAAIASEERTREILQS